MLALFCHALGVQIGEPVGVAVADGEAVGVGVGVPHGTASHLPAFTITRPNSPVKFSGLAPR
jgi:hypothetical protein